jgi:transposase
MPVQVPAEQRLCVCCQHEMQVVGVVDHERVEYVPAKVVVHVERREKLACRQSGCRGDITTAPRADEEGSRRRAGASLLAQLIEAKCDDGLPVERQRDQWLRLGFEVPADTLYTYWRHATSLLVPVADVVRSKVLGEDVVGVDDTSLPVLDKSRKAGIYKGHLWCFTGRYLVAYAFTESWSADEVAPFLSAVDGFIQCDDYAGYGREIELSGGERRVLVPPEQRLGCMMHVRRRFHEALKLCDKRAARGVALIAELYDIERMAKDQRLAADARLGLRTERSLPVLAQFDAWVDELKPTCLPTSPLGKALGYAMHQRPFVHRCFTDGRFEIDNGHTDRVLREPCIGRKNYLFTGSADAAERLAAAYTLVQSCRLLGFGARDYLVDVLTKLDAGWPMRRVAELAPDSWARERGLFAQADHAR